MILSTMVLRKRVPSLDSAADAATHFDIVHRVSTVLLRWTGLPSFGSEPYKNGRRLRCACFGCREIGYVEVDVLTMLEV